MKKLSTRITAIRRNLPVIIGVFLCVYFSYHTISGERNYQKLNELRAEVQQKEQILAALKEQNVQLEDKVTMLRPDSLSVDMLEEQIRGVLGYEQEDEISLVELSRH